MATPVPPPSPRHLRLLRLLLSGLVLCAALRGASAAVARPDACPRSLDCTLKKRARCPPGAHVCGPCLQPFQEDEQGQCVLKSHPPAVEGPSQPRMEDEIDILAQELAWREAGHLGLMAPPRSEGGQLLKGPAASRGLSEQGQGPDSSPPSTRGVPTPHTSLGSPVSTRPVHVSPLAPRVAYGDSLVGAVLVVASSVAGATALFVAAVCWCRLQREMRLAEKTDYAATQATSCPLTTGILPGDQRLAHSAEMYHYQHQRQQMLSLERHKEPPKVMETASSDEENEDGDFTVYECPGLAPTGEMEVRNPLFDHSSLSGSPLGPRAVAPPQ